MRLSLIALMVYLARQGWVKCQNSPGLLFLYFVFGGAVAGLFFIKGVLPWMVEAVTTSLFSSGEKIRPEDIAETSEAEEKSDGEVTPPEAK